jgi:hypothetical protein
LPDLIRLHIDALPPADLFDQRGVEITLPPTARANAGSVFT